MDGVIRPRVQVTGALVHGWTTSLYIASDKVHHGGAPWHKSEDFHTSYNTSKKPDPLV